MPRNRPGKKERAVKRTQDQRALEKLHDQIHTERSSGGLHQVQSKKNTKVSKPEKSDRTYTSSEVDAIVQAAVTAAVTTTVTTTKALFSGEKPKQTANDSKPARTLAERITGRDPQLTAESATSKKPTRSLADRITFPQKH
jgi:hypothetical protein